MAYYLEYKIRGSLEARSVMPAGEIADVLGAASDVLQEAGSRTALLRREVPAASGRGEDTVAAVYTEAEGWKPA